MAMATTTNTNEAAAALAALAEALRRYAAVNPPQGSAYLSVTEWTGTGYGTDVLVWPAAGEGVARG